MPDVDVGVDERFDLLTLSKRGPFNGRSRIIMMELGTSLLLSSICAAANQTILRPLSKDLLNRRKDRLQSAFFVFS